MARVPWNEHVRVESSGEGLPPLVVAQAGPGLPVLHERRRYRRLLSLEDHFSVFFWDRSGTGLHDPPPQGLSLEIHLEEMVALLREQSRLDLFRRWPVSSVPVDMLFGAGDLLSPPAVIERARAVPGPRDTLRVVPDAAHMVHFDAPAVVRSAIVGTERTTER